MLDLVLKLPGHPWIWAEGKMVDDNLFGPTERQWVEGVRWIKDWHPVLLFGWKKGFMFVWPWTKQANIRTCFFGSPWVRVLKVTSRRKPTMNLDDYLRDKTITNGDFGDQSNLAQALKFGMRQGKNWNPLSMAGKEALELIQTSCRRSSAAIRTKPSTGTTSRRSLA